MSTVLAINSVTIDRVATTTTILHCRPYAQNGYPELTFARAIRTLTSGPDPWDAQTVTLTEGGTLIFAGDTGTHLTHYDNKLGWVREWTCHGLAKRAERIPVTDSDTLTDTIRYNLPPDDPDYIPSRAGRSMGQIVAAVLEMSTNKESLDAVGVGNYSSAGTGAVATCVLSGGGVDSTVTIDDGGSGYSSTPAVLFSGGGGSAAAGTAAVSGGAVTGITVTNAGSGYTAAPIVILSTLPSTTLADLDGLTVIPPFEVDIAGERILQSLEGVVQAVHPNHFVQVAPNGDIRFLDPRTFAADVTLTMDDPMDPRVGRPSITADWSSCYSRVVVRGHDLVVPVTLQLLPWEGSSDTDGGLIEDFAHDGLTNAQAKANWQATDFTTPQTSPGTATAHCTISSGAVNAVTLDQPGYGYASAPTVAFSGGGGSGASVTATISGGVVTGFTSLSGGSGYTSAPTVTLTGPAVGQSDVGTVTTMGSTTSVTVQSAGSKTNWTADYWDYSPTGHQGVVVLYQDGVTDYTQTFTARIIANTSLSAGGTSVLTLDSPAPATTYNSYQIYGTAGGASFVWRRYTVTNADIAARLANYFPYPVAYRNSNGLSATLTSTPVATVFDGLAQSGIGVCVDPTSGTILLSRPSALVFSADGVTPVVPTNVQAFLPVHTGALETVYPPDSGGPVYDGTSFTVLGLERTKTITVNDWRDASNLTNMTIFAQEAWSALSDVVYEGSIPYYGLLSAPLEIGHALNITGSTYDTGWEALNLPIIAVDLEYCERGGGTSYKTTLTFSNRRAPFSGAALQRPAMTGQPLGISGDFGTAAQTFEAAGSIRESAGQVGNAMASQTDAAAASAGQSAAAGMGDVVTGLESPQAGLMG